MVAGPPQHSPDVRDELLAAAARDGRIEILEEGLSRQGMLSLIGACDCYVSLHRSEGFGLGMVEAMSLGRPVIGTDCSASTDFLTEATGFPVPYALTPVCPGEYVHSDGQVWAAPNEAAAAAAMVRVVADPGEAAARAAAGRRLVEANYGTEAVARAAGDRLNEIFDQQQAAALPR